MTKTNNAGRLARCVSGGSVAAGGVVSVMPRAVLRAVVRVIFVGRVMRIALAGRGAWLVANAARRSLARRVRAFADVLHTLVQRAVVIPLRASARKEMMISSIVERVEKLVLCVHRHTQINAFSPKQRRLHVAAVPLLLVRKGSAAMGDAVSVMPQAARMDVVMETAVCCPLRRIFWRVVGSARSVQSVQREKPIVAFVRRANVGRIRFVLAKPLAKRGCADVIPYLFNRSRFREMVEAQPSQQAS
jgi:hypothetical protein